MRVAILTDTDKELVEFPEHIFREMLKKYLSESDNNVELAMDKIVFELKQLTITV